MAQGKLSLKPSFECPQDSYVGAHVLAMGRKSSRAVQNIKCFASLKTVTKAMSKTALPKIILPASQHLMCEAAPVRTAGPTENATQWNHMPNVSRVP